MVYLFNFLLTFFISLLSFSLKFNLLYSRITFDMNFQAYLSNNSKNISYYLQYLRNTTCSKRTKVKIKLKPIIARTPYTA